MEPYWLSILGVLILCLLSVALAVYSGSSKGFAGALSGPVIPADDANLLYRIDRVHMNSVEALAPFVVPAVLAMMVGVGSATLATIVWVHVAIRLLHLGFTYAAAMPPRVAVSERSSTSLERSSRLSSSL
ncbi:MAPEG family protein [Mesorhizobium sp. M1004]|uniref:MAPEG family protein n=1 Tax=Mesorhizobium sp. M1004 TaxID=2957046 RepID=UPI0033383A1E